MTLVRFETEEELCAAFIVAAEADGWAVYPEQGEWDILLERRGLQVGVQAKLRFNVDLAYQAAAHKLDEKGPHYRCALVPEFPHGSKAADRWGVVLGSLRVLVLVPPPDKGRWWAGVETGWLTWRIRRVGMRTDWLWYRHRPKQTIWVPPFEPNLPAGVPSPVSVSQWQVAAILLERTHDQQGWVSVDDVRTIAKGIGGAWSPYTMLNAYFKCTDEPVAEKSRKKKWLIKTKPSKRYPAVDKGLSQNSSSG